MHAKHEQILKSDNNETHLIFQKNVCTWQIEQYDEARIVILRGHCTSMQT